MGFVGNYAPYGYLILHLSVHPDFLLLVQKRCIQDLPEMHLFVPLFMNSGIKEKRPGRCPEHLCFYVL